MDNFAAAADTKVFSQIVEQGSKTHEPRVAHDLLKVLGQWVSKFLFSERRDR